MGEEHLAALRAEIDALDAELVALIARRVQVIDRVIVVKQREALPALIPSRVEQVVAHARRRAQEAGTDADLVETVWRAMIAASIAYEERQLGP